MDDSPSRCVKIHWSGTLPSVIDVVVQRWTFSRMRESFAAHVGQRELSPMSRLRRIHSLTALRHGNGNNDGEVCPSIPPILLHPMACCIALACCVNSAASCDVNCPLVCLAFTWFKKELSWLQAGVSWLRFNCVKAAFSGASKLVVTPLGRLKLFIVLIRFCVPWVGVRTVQLKVAGVGSVLPWVSTALTANLCCPAARLL